MFIHNDENDENIAHYSNNDYITGNNEPGEVTFRCIFVMRHILIGKKNKRRNVF